MRRSKKLTLTLLLSLGVLSIAGCSVRVDDKDKEKAKVDIQTPFANLKVDTSQASTDNGIPVYPGAKPREADRDGDKHRANVNIGGANFGVKIIAAEYVTPDAPDKVKTFYLDKLKRYGQVLECQGTSHHGDDSVGDVNAGDSDEKLSCGDSYGKGWELKVGTKHDQHIVSIEPDGSGTRFGTVFLQIHGKEGTL
jgi:hypothetical protein